MSATELFASSASCTVLLPGLPQSLRYAVADGQPSTQENSAIVTSRYRYESVLSVCCLALVSDWQAYNALQYQNQQPAVTGFEPSEWHVNRCRRTITLKHSEYLAYVIQCSCCLISMLVSAAQRDYSSVPQVMLG